MYLGYHEEGDNCPEPKCGGKLFYPQPENCSCHINPPCNHCTNVLLTCGECGWEDDAPEYKYVPLAPELAIREYRPKPLNKNKIDYRLKMHTHFSQIAEGVYPEGTTRDEVRKIVDGTFGGRFESFGNGKFVFVRYTD